MEAAVPGALPGRISCLETTYMKTVHWTPTLVGRFWDGLTETSLLDLAFSRLAGHWLLRALEWHLSPGRRHLDFGSGDGHFAKLLAAKGYPAAVYEPSQGRLGTLRRALGGVDGFLGLAGEGDAPFDVVFMIEVIEHILDEQMDEAMALLDRFVAPDGLLIVTTPNSENLDHGMAYEPVSGALFHRWQHVRSFTATSLVELLGRYGFEPLVVHQLEFSDRLFGEAGGRIGTADYFSNLFNTMRPIYLGDGGGLVYVGRRKRSGADAPLADIDQNWRKQPFVVGTTTTLSIPGSPRLSAADAAPPVAEQPRPSIELEIPATAIRHYSGQCWTIGLKGLPVGDDLADGFRSPLELYENLLPLGPGHYDHQGVGTLGQGRFSHWGTDLYFSSSDNTPPNENGRKYVIRLPAPGVDVG